MAGFRQISTFYEDGYGTVTVLFVVADTYDDLFATAAHPDIDVVQLKTTKKDLDLQAGVQAEDELTFTLDEASASGAADSNAVAFILDARDAAVLRYVALFVNPVDPDAPTNDEAEFTGVIRPEFHATDSVWSGGQWSESPSPVRVWDVTARPFWADILESVPLKDLIYGNATTGVSAAFNTAWETAWVADRMGYFRDTSSGREALWGSITSVNAALESLCAALANGLQVLGRGTYAISIVNSTCGFRIIPQRIAYCKRLGGGYGRYAYAKDSSNTKVYRVRSDDAFEPMLGWPAGWVPSALSNTHLYCQYQLVKPSIVDKKDVYSPPGTNAQAIAFERYDNLAELIYAVAFALGMYVRFTYIGSSDLQIEFVPRAGVSQHRVWLRDATKADLDTSPMDPDDDKQFYGAASGLAGEGGHYIYDAINGVYKLNDEWRDAKREGDQLLFSIGIPFRSFKPGYAADGENWSDVLLPHNARFYNGGAAVTTHPAEYYDAKGSCTTLFCRTAAVGDTDTTVEHGLNGTDDVIEPVGLIGVRVSGVYDYWFDTLESYVSWLIDRDGAFYKTEYSIDVPYLCSWRKSADGTHPDDDGGRGRILNLALGCEYVQDGVEYVVVGIERDWAVRSTRLRLQNIDRFAFGEPDNPATTDGSVPALADGGDGYQATLTRECVAGEALAQGDVLYMAADGALYRATATDAVYGRIVGVAAHAAATDEVVSVLLPPSICDSLAYAFSSGDRLYLRTGSPNVSSSRLASNTGTENLFLELGTALSPASFRFELGEQFVFPPTF
ncbi:MAG: DUF2190 family protein [Ignavibacteriae bacterium]|nr:DUF2190 family protein [Ignavibacteriota bacterium]